MTIVIGCKSHEQTLRVRAGIEKLIEPIHATIKENTFSHGIMEFEGFPGFIILLVNRMDGRVREYQGVVLRAEDVLDWLPRQMPDEDGGL